MHFIMATVYILYSESIDKFYTGSCKILSERLAAHRNNKFSRSFTRRASDWKLFFQIDNLTYRQGRKIESHIKRMKSKIYIKNLIIHAKVSEELVLQYYYLAKIYIVSQCTLMPVCIFIKHQEDNSLISI